MGTMLNEREAEYVKTLMKRDEIRMRLGWFFMMLLVLGGLVIVISAFVALRNMNDDTILRETIPGFVLGLAFIALSIGGVWWVKQQHLLASIVRKLQQTHQSE